MANIPITDYVLVDDLSVNEFEETTGKVRLKFDPASPITLKSDSLAGMVFDYAPGMLAAATTVSNVVTGSGATQSIVTTVNGKSSAAVLVPDTIGVKPVTTVFDGTTGILTTTLSDGTSLTANIGVAAADQFLKTAVYDSATATLKLTMSNGSVKSVPLSDLVKVTTGFGLTGDGTTAAPVMVVVDPASTSGVVSVSSAGLKVTLPPVTPPTVTLSVSGSGATRSIAPIVNGTTGAAVSIPDLDSQTLSLAGQVLIISSGNSVTLPSASPYTGGTTQTTKDTVTDQVITTDVIIDPALTNVLVAGPSGLSAKVITSNPLVGSGTAANPLTVAIDPASTPGVVSVSGAGLKVSAPAASPVTNSFYVNQTTGAVSTVSGVKATQVIAPGPTVQSLGFDTNGNLAYNPTITTEIHQLTGGDFPNFAVFNGRTYPVAQWTPFLIGETWQFSGASQLQRHQLQWSVNAAGNWTVQLDLAGNTAINETWPAIQVGFMRIAPTRFGGI